MKKLLITLAITTALLTGCKSFMYSHNANTVAAGKVFKIGAADYGLLYVNGLVAMEAVRENSELVVETNDGDSFGNPASAAKGIRSIRFRTASQISGYLVDLAKKDPAAAEKYVENMPKMNKAAWDARQDAPIEPAKISGGAGKAKDKASAADAIEPFKCDGDCDLANLDSISSRLYQTAVAKKLLTYADDTTKFDGEELTLKASLEQFLTRMEQYKAKGIDTVGLRVRRATVKANKLTAIRYVYYEDGREIETNCPECIFIPELDYKGEAAK